MSNQDPAGWLEATKMASEALAIAKNTAAIQRAHLHITMLMLTTLGRSARPEAVEQLMAEFERVRDLSGPAGIASGEIFATAASTLERASRNNE